MASSFPDIHFLPLCVLLLLSFFFFSCSLANGSFEENEGLDMVTQPAGVTHHILSLQWPISICSQENRRCHRDIVVPSRFTIHGLWPANANGAPVINCNPRDLFNWSQVMSLDDYPQRQLSTKWPTLSNSITQQAFFRQEWIKHGTCSGLNQTEYFRRTLNLYDISNVLYRLREIGVVPGTRTYNPTNVVTQYRTKWGQTIQITCVRRVSNPRVIDMLGEIRFRVDLSATTIGSITGVTNLCRTTPIEFLSKRPGSGFPMSSS